MKCISWFVTIGIVFMICAVAQVHPNQAQRGGEWLSWSTRERNTYVYGQISGYYNGSLKACNTADELFDVDLPQRDGNEKKAADMPSMRCLARRETFSKCRFTSTGTDCSAYAIVITDFYKKYPEYREISFSDLIDALRDGKSEGVDQLHRMALTGELRPPS